MPEKHYSHPSYHKGSEKNLESKEDYVRRYIKRRMHKDKPWFLIKYLHELCKRVRIQDYFQKLPQTIQGKKMKH